MATGNFIAYYRVSTDKQGKSGLGLEAQQAAVAAYLNGGDWKLVAEYTEVETGTSKKQRPVLAEAMAACKLYGATLIIAKLDRLARNVAFISSLMEAGVEFVACDMPTANKFTVHILAAVAEHEAAMISARTKAGLAAKKARGEATGAACWKSDSGMLSEEDRKKGQALGTESIKANKAERWSRVLPMLQRLQGEGMSFRKIAAELNRLGVPTANKKRGGTDGECSQWSATVVSRILKG